MLSNIEGKEGRALSRNVLIAISAQYHLSKNLRQYIQASPIRQVDLRLQQAP
jgi:hypothetical protein